ncbi:MAG TPA: PspC domain-containing protein, partial [Gaiellaceae bacterium]|nr:PspC domain-containing protein [Gaiellaceae bacterium]
MTETLDTTPPLDEAPARRLVRVDEGRWLGGVAAGLGRYFDVNPLVYRIAFAALALAGGTGVLLYLAAWLVMPNEDRDESVAVETLRVHRDRPWLLLGVGLLGLAAVLTLTEADFWPGNGNVWFAAILAGGALVWWNLARGNERVAAAAVGETLPPSTPKPQGKPRRPSVTAPVFGALLAATGVFGLLAVLDIYDVDVSVALAAAVVIVGAAIAFGAQTGRRFGGLIPLGLVLLAGFGIAASSPVSFTSGVGDRNEQPLAVSETDRSYEHGIGDFTLELADTELPAGTTHIEAKLGIGELVVTVPEDAALVIDAHTAAGRVDALGQEDDGL